MRIFVTGATGFIGAAVVGELLDRGHLVRGLARSDHSAASLLARGVEVHRGDIAEPASVVGGLTGVDAVIHTAFDHDFSRYVDNCRSDARLLETIAGALDGSHTALVATSATTVVGPGHLATEEEDGEPANPRTASEEVLHHAARGLAVSIVRLPPSVYGRGDTAFIPALIALARQTGVSAYVGDGSNRWPAVHRDDAARLFCDAVEQAGRGLRYHAVGHQGIALRAIADAIGAGADVPTRSLTQQAGSRHFGWLARFVTIDAPASGAQTRATTGWTPREKDLFESLKTDGYFTPLQQGG
ncbi:MAG: SDR family oxidoreductase [Pseudomonadota bacterium]|nr:SDR family oxidoreductase [Pseudomonadota bacterium]